MTPTEAIALARIARAACPQQHFDKHTPDTWHDLLGDLDFDDAREGLLAAVKAKPFVAPAEIREQVGRIRRERSRNHVIAAPQVDPDDSAAYAAGLRAANRAAAARPSGHLELTNAADEVTAARAAQFREQGYKPYLSGSGQARRGSGVETAVEAARRACMSASSKLHAEDPGGELSETEQRAREIARRAKHAQARRHDPKGVSDADMRRVMDQIRNAGDQDGTA